MRELIQRLFLTAGAAVAYLGCSSAGYGQQIYVPSAAPQPTGIFYYYEGVVYYYVPAGPATSTAGTRYFYTPPADSNVAIPTPPAPALIADLPDDDSRPRAWRPGSGMPYPRLTFGDK